MKTFLIFIALSFTYPIVTFSQPPSGMEQREKKIESLYIAYITRELNLTETEAQKFWPVHSEYDSELRASSKEMPELERQQLVLNIKKKYQPRFSKILGAERTDNFFKTDSEFKKRLLERVQKARQQKGDKGRRPR